MLQKCQLQGKHEFNADRVQNVDILIVVSWVDLKMILSFSEEHKRKTTLD